MPDSLMATYKRLPVTFSRGEGAWVWDTDGKRYLDALAGIAVCGLGHAHPRVTEAICRQAGLLTHTSNLYDIELQSSLAVKLTRLAAMDKVFFANSGAEANEAAIKIARAYGHSKGIQLPTIVVMQNSFHGRTLATLTATGNRKVQAGFEPLVQGFVRIPFDDLGALESVAQNTPDVVAVMVEPIQGEGGVNIPSPDFLDRVHRLCQKQGWLLMLDEIQTGMGRTGRMFAHQHSTIVPDVMTLAKALGNGVPIGACLAKGEAANVLRPGSHGSTFGGNPLACSAAAAVLQAIADENLLSRAERLGDRLLSGFRSNLNALPGVVDIRGKGLMIGIELDRPCADIVGEALRQGMLINVTAERVVRLLPPLVLRDDQADDLVRELSALIRKFLNDKDSAENLTVAGQ